MSLVLYPFPWAHFCEHQGLDVVPGANLEMSSPLLPTIVSANGDNIRLDGISLAPRDGTSCRMRSWDIPIGNRSQDSGPSYISFGNGKYPVEFRSNPKRKPVELREQCPREQWLRWQLQRYSELAELDRDHLYNAPLLEAPTKRGARRSWSTVLKHWRQSGEESAELALIVRLAKNRQLTSSLDAIERSPRKMLFREHRKQRIAKIQEMNSTTLRAYSRAPGRNAIEKAGSKQELLAVVRQDTVDLPENRVTRWVAGRLRTMAAAYCTRNQEFANSHRVRKVKQLQRSCERLLASARFRGVSGLPHHLASPTYCLQFEARYRIIWRAYCLLRRQDRIEDDSWKWQSHLWGSSMRCLAGTMLLGLEGWSERRVSTPSFLAEGVSGEWTEGLFAPGPLKTPFGECVIADSRSAIMGDILEYYKVPDSIRGSHADWILIWPKSKSIVLMWSAVSSGVGRDQSIGGERLSTKLQALSCSCEWKFAAVLMIAEPEADDVMNESNCIDATNNLVTMIWVPENVHQRWEDIQTSVQLGVEALFRE